MKGPEDRSVAWWEWLLAPILLPLILVVRLVVAIVSAPFELVYNFRKAGEEPRLRRRLVAAGRFLEWPEVEAKLRAGTGTLIVEHRSPGGPIRDWWTPEDLIAAAPVPVPVSVKSRPAEGQPLRQQMHEYAEACAARNVNVESGSAKLTEFPVPSDRQPDSSQIAIVDLGGGWTSPVRLVTGRNLAEKYPAAKIVTLVTWLGGPLLFVGDIETIFLD